MKRHLYLTIAVMTICGVLVVSGNAWTPQTVGSPTLRARIPFAFAVGDKNLPAGDYIVKILNPSSDRKALQIKSENGRFSAIIQTVGVNGALAKDAKLVFRRYGDQYFFAQAHMAGDTTRLTATKTRAERATQKAVRRPDSGSVVAIAAH